MGMGVAGSYLMARLKNSEHEVAGYERMTEENHDSICAWGTIKDELDEFCKNTGRNFDEYLIHDGKTMHVRHKHDVKLSLVFEGRCRD